MAEAEQLLAMLFHFFDINTKKLSAALSVYHLSMKMSLQRII